MDRVRPTDFTLDLSQILDGSIYGVHFLSDGALELYILLAAGSTPGCDEGRNWGYTQARGIELPGNERI